jgi:hypothetical protein
MIQLINLLSSPRILEVLTELLTPKTREELKSRIPTSTSSLSQVLNRMISLNLIARHGETFRILPKGELVLRIYETIAGYEKFLNKFAIILLFLLGFLLSPLVTGAILYPQPFFPNRLHSTFFNYSIHHSNLSIH